MYFVLFYNNFGFARQCIRIKVDKGGKQVSRARSPWHACESANGLYSADARRETGGARAQPARPE